MWLWGVHDSAVARRVAGNSAEGNSITDSTRAASSVMAISAVQESEPESGLSFICGPHAPRDTRLRTQKLPLLPQETVADPRRLRPDEPAQLDHALERFDVALVDLQGGVVEDRRFHFVVITESSTHSPVPSRVRSTSSQDRSQQHEGEVRDSAPEYLHGRSRYYALNLVEAVGHAYWTLGPPPTAWRIESTQAGLSPAGVRSRRAQRGHS